MGRRLTLTPRYMTEAQGQEVIDLLTAMNEYAITIEYAVMLTAGAVSLLLGVTMWRILILGKNQRNWW